MKEEDDQNLGKPIPTRFSAEVEAIISELVANTGLDRTQVIRRAVRLLIEEVKKRGGAEWLKDSPARPGLSFLGAKSKKLPAKAKRAHLTDIEWVSLSIVGVSSCGKLVPSEGNVIGEVKVRAGKYPADAFCIRADGDSMNRAKLPDGRRGIKTGEVVICRTLEHTAATVGKIVVALCDGETCIKRLEEDAKGKYLAPESSNPEHKPIRLSKHARVQAVVIDKV